MSAAENVRSFWAAKSRADSPLASSPRLREGPTMEGLRSTLQRTKSWEKAKNLPRTSPTKISALPNDIVTKSPFKEHDQAVTPQISPSAFRISTNITKHSHVESTPVKRAESPTKSSFASPELAKYGALSRSKSVTFNEQTEVRHMSDCSFDTISTPYSTPEHRKYSSDEDCADESDESAYAEQDVDERHHSWTAPNTKALPNLEDPFDSTSTRALPAIPVPTTGSRPLPTVPGQRPHSPGEKILATEQEESRKSLSGLGLQLANNSSSTLAQSHGTSGFVWNADQAIIRRNSQRALQDVNESEDDNEGEAALATATVQNVPHGVQSLSNDTSLSGPVRASPKLKTYSQSRSPEPAISKEYIKARLAQRKANQEMEQDALRPNHSLAPPLPHFDSFAKLSPTAAVDALQTVEPDSPASESNFPSTVVLQRKVSDTHRPVTPVDQLQTEIAEPQSARSVHHEREKRLSSEITSTMQPVSKPVFTAVNYDGDEYEDDFDGRSADDLIIHPLPSDLISKLVETSEHVEPVTLLQNHNAESQTDDEPVELADNELHAAQYSFEDNITNAQSTGPDSRELIAESAPSTPAISSFDFGGLSLSLNFDTDNSDTLGLEQYMTPEKRPETPIAFRTVAPASPTKSSPGQSGILDVAVQPEAATITARGMKLRTRPSLTPADTTELAARRRKVSSEIADSDLDYGHGAVLGRVRSDSVLSVTLDASHSEKHREGVAEIESPSDEEADPMSKIQPIAMPVLEPLKREMSFSDINNAFDRVMQKQKKGYVVRQQSRIVHASTTHDEASEEISQLADPSLDPKGHTRQSSSVYTDISTFSSATKKSSENYNSHRRQGSRIPVGVHMSPKPMATSTTVSRPKNMPGPLNGGRLFVKVMNIKNLSLPIPKGEESFFCCTLDNGKHCVTTPWHTLSADTKINQEFELIADHDLEFILTLQAQYTPPTMPTRPKSTLGRLLHSPKKHRPTGSITSLSLAGYVGSDGSFARAHMALKHFRDQAFGRPHTLLVPVLNEWAIETTGTGPKGVPLTRQRKPYKIGAIELQLLYVPPVGPEHRQLLPTSLSQAARELRDAEWHNKLHCEGYLSQQGGDCPYWRRRHFKLLGSKLTAYHANSGQIRATINLSKATSVTDDKESLTAPDVSTSSRDNKKRRKSGFAEREEGHLYVSEGFRIRFANGEAIDFYADSAADKARWMEVLEGLVGKVPIVREWCRVVLESENTTEILPAKE